MKRKLTMQEIMDIELVGVVNTINDYTREHFIKNYTDVLLKCELPKDKELMISVVYRLIDWYTETLNDIKNNEYLFNKGEHYKSIEVLNELSVLMLED